MMCQRSLFNRLLGGLDPVFQYRRYVLDTDYASETENMIKMQVLAQATAAMLTQATASQRDTILALIDRQQFHYVI